MVPESNAINSKNTSFNDGFDPCDRIYHKPYLAEIYKTEPQTCYYVYPKSELASVSLFSYLILDGGAHLFAVDTFGDASAETLLQKTMDGSAFDFLRDKNGNIDWGLSYKTSETAGMPKQHEWQSWPQRLYHLLPLAREFMVTGDRKYSEAWLRLLRLWIADCPYEPLDKTKGHVNTSMKWRDMQSSWRTVTLLHSLYMLTTYENVFSKEVFAEIYDFLVLNLDHLAKVASHAIEKNMLGNHTLQMASALITAGTVLPELPASAEYYNIGCRVMKLCFDANVLSDGGTREMGPSYNHFIARLYLEAQKNCELNGYEGIAGLHDSLIRQYQWLASVATRKGMSLPLSDAYVMDSHADVARMARLIPFEPDFSKKSVYLPESGHLYLRCGEWELALDAQDSVGGHQHFGRIQPILSYADEAILVDSGCCNYDRGNLYSFLCSSKAHSVISAEEIPDNKNLYSVKVTEFNAELATATAELQAVSGEDSYTWRRTVSLTDDCVYITDTVNANRPLSFVGRFYLEGRPTAMTDAPEEKLITYNTCGHIAKQRLSHGTLTLTSSEQMKLEMAVGMDKNDSLTQNACLVWHADGDSLCVSTKISCKKTEM